MTYRPEIDGLRAYAVLAVIAFHLNVLPKGFLGVDVFFVISGYLITGIILKEKEKNSFSLKQFYLRRIRRILPLLSVVCIVSLGIGMATMLPNDLENLGNSVVATQLFSNNFLELFTTKDYWNIANEYKPLMHTWSLGVEEQFYLLFPWLFLIFRQNSKKVFIAILCLITALSFLLFLSSVAWEQKFYLLPFRMFELTMGGLAFLLFKGKFRSPWLFTMLFLGVISLLILDFPAFPFYPHMLSLILLTVLMIGIEPKESIATKILLTNPVIVWVGKISFSLYMWHQVVFAFTRYIFQDPLSTFSIAIDLCIIFSLSTLSYYIIEQPFRNESHVSTKKLFLFLSSLASLSISLGLYLYSQYGIIRNVPELEINRSHLINKPHSQYNHRIEKLDTMFSERNKFKILTIGDSYARDWANILLESSYASELEISYIADAENHPNLDTRSSAADLIFCSRFRKKNAESLFIPLEKLWCVGTKYFGRNNGIHYNYRGDDFCQQTVRLDPAFIKWNNHNKEEWGKRYVDLINTISPDSVTVPVFTPDCKFISQDCRHLTKAGAKYFAKLLQQDTSFVLHHYLQKN